MITNYNDAMISQDYAQKSSRYKSGTHSGIDLVFPKGSSITPYRGGEGTVIETGYNSSYGNYVVIQNAYDQKVRYAHFADNSIPVSIGDQVTVKDVIGVQGSTGNSTGDHVHIDITSKNGLVDPKTQIYSGLSMDNPYGTKEEAEAFAESYGNDTDWSQLPQLLQENVLRILLVGIAVLFLYIALKSVFLGR